MSSRMKWLFAAIAFVGIAGAADVVYPKWKWSCAAQGELAFMPSIPEVKDEPQLGGPFRYFDLTVPNGCTATPENMLRRLIEQF